MTYKLDIFSVLTNINGNEFDFYSALDEEQQKAFVPVVTMKWLLGTPNGKHIKRLNDRVNKYVFPLAKHKELLYHLMCTTTTGKNVRYKYIKTATQNKGSKPVSTGVIEEYYKYSTAHALDVLPLFELNDIIEMAEYVGRQSDDITKIQNEYKATKAKSTKGKGGAKTKAGV